MGTLGWTAEDDAKLKQLATEGASAGEIGERMGRSRNSICGRAWRLGVTLRGAKKPGGKTRLRKDRPNRQYVQKVKLTPRVQPAPQVAAPQPLPLAEALPVATLAPLPASAVSWDNLQDGCCKWPVGSMFCGAVAMPRKPYCPQHTYESKQALAPPREARRPVPRARYW